MKILAIFLLVISVYAQKPVYETLDAVKAVREPDKRYWAALEFASTRIDLSRKSYGSGEMEPFKQALEDAMAAVRLCDDTLRGTGKEPSKNPRHFKRAELKIRELLRRLKAFEDQASVDDRAPIADTRAKISHLHDELLLDIMGRRK